MTELFSKKYGPSISQLFMESFNSLHLLKMRSILALIGIVIGSASIIALMNISYNASNESIRSFKSLGTDTIIINFPTSSNNKFLLPSSINTDDLKKKNPYISYIAPITLSSAHISHYRMKSEATIIGSSSDLDNIMELRIKNGRFISEFDNKESFIVVGNKVAHELSTQERKLQVGDLLQINNYLFQVIGILESIQNNPFVPLIFDESIITPIENMNRLQKSSEIGILIGKSTTDISNSANILKEYLINLVNGRKVEIQVPQYLIDGLKSQTMMFSYLLAGLGSISLLLGGIGVMNVMLMNISERRKEIGIRMALGARPQDIRTLFLLEAINISTVGAILGAFLGFIIAYTFTQIVGWQFYLDTKSFILGSGSSLLVGLFFGLYPAISAAKLQPIQLLRD